MVKHYRIGRRRHPVSRFFNPYRLTRDRGAESIAEHFIHTGHLHLALLPREGVDSRKGFIVQQKIASHGLKLAKDNSFWIAKGEGKDIRPY